MNVLTATSAGQGAEPDDYCFAIDDELVIFPLNECPDELCACQCEVAGLVSRRVTTTFAVTDRPKLDHVTYRALIRDELVALGYLDDRGTLDEGWVDAYIDELIFSRRSSRLGPSS